MNRRQLIKTLMGLVGASSVSLPALANNKNQSTQLTTRKKLLAVTVAGYQYYQGEQIEATLKPGQELQLKREQGNYYDELAVSLYHGDSKLGYLPRQYNGVPAQLMDKGEQLIATIKQINPDKPTWKRMTIEIYLDIKWKH